MNTPAAPIIILILAIFIVFTAVVKLISWLWVNVPRLIADISEPQSPPIIYHLCKRFL